MFHIFANLSLSLLPVLSVVVVQRFSSVFPWVLTVVVQVLVLNKIIQNSRICRLKKDIKKFVRSKMTNSKTGCRCHIKIILESHWFSKILVLIYFHGIRIWGAWSTMRGDTVSVYSTKSAKHTYSTTQHIDNYMERIERENFRREFSTL